MAADAPTIRAATEEDVPIILQFIHELAAYEKAEHEVEATEESLRETLTFAAPNTTTTTSTSSRKPRGGAVHTFLVTPPTAPGSSSSSSSPVGMALFFYNYSTWRAAPGVYLEDLYVQPSQRGRGSGHALLRALAGETRRIGGRRLEWSVLHWNEPSIRFYEGLGARRMGEWVKMMVEGDDALARLAEDDLGR